MKQCSYFSAFIFIAAAGHTQAKPLQASGQSVQLEKRVANFTLPNSNSLPLSRSIPSNSARTLSLEGNFSCEFRQGNSHEMMIQCSKGDDSLLESIVTNDSIQLRSNVTTDSPLMVTVVLPNISEIRVRGKCHFRARSIQATSLRVICTDESNAQFSGEMGHLEIDTSDHAICSMTAVSAREAIVYTRDSSMVNGSANCLKARVQARDMSSICGNLRIRKLDCVLDDEASLEASDVGRLRKRVGGGSVLKVVEPDGVFTANWTGELRFEKTVAQPTSTVKVL
jgi:hypothetical protein